MPSFRIPVCSLLVPIILSTTCRLGVSFPLPCDVGRTNSRLTSELLVRTNPEDETSQCSRRTWIDTAAKSAALGFLYLQPIFVPPANADEEEDFNEEFKELYDNPAIPQAPEEKSGLVVLRVAEVAQFQEKILRAIASGELEGVKVAPMQFVFGTQILLRNSNLDGNMKLMIYQEMPKSNRSKAIKNAVVTMNTLQGIAKYAGSIKRDFEPQEMVELADMYLQVRINLNQMYEYLPQKEKDKYYGYFVAVTEYEKKIAEGVYNPDIDGVLKFDD